MCLMKNWICFLLGFISGIVFTFIATIVIASGSSASNNGMTFFEQPGECLDAKAFEVMQVLDSNYALAHEIKWNYVLERYVPTDLLVLVTNDNGEYYYDDQIIKIPKGKCMRQVGIYKYQTRMEIEKTVPIVKIMD